MGGSLSLRGWNWPDQAYMAQVEHLNMMEIKKNMVYLAMCCTLLWTTGVHGSDRS